MKNFSLFILLALSTQVFSSCGAIETIFKAGMWWAFFLVGLFIVIILWVVFKARKK
jgi:hypothetical protein